jgi:formylglycine-generating enzyme required for sulfatase activity
MVRSFAPAVLFGVPLVAALASCQETPPPLPSALMIVDTDVDVPRTVSRLRVDIFGEDGTWLHSRDVPRIHPTDWPASFGVLAPDESHAQTVLVRLRAYPDGATRDYRGTHYEPRPTYTPPRVPESLEELCSSLEELPPFVEKTMRRGRVSLTADGCHDFEKHNPPYGAGPTAVRVTIPAKGRYRFEVIRSIPSKAVVEPDTTLFLRRDCMAPKSEIACNDDIEVDSFGLSRLVTEVEAGSYVLMTGGEDGQPGDLTLRWTPEAEWGPEEVVSRPPPMSSASTLVAAANPRLVLEGEDATPTSEPLPAATIDRLVRVRLEPKRAGEIRVTLRGACAGTAADLSAIGAKGVAMDSVRTCIDDPATFDPPPIETVVAPSPPRPSAQGTMIDEPCAPEDSDDRIVCVPGGTFVMGGSELEGLDEAGLPSNLPVRIAALHRFWIDRYEVTIGRYREAARNGFDDASGTPLMTNNGEFRTGSLLTEALYTTKPGDRERYPVNTLSWSHADAMCRFYGGSLPTNAEWEYAASAAGRPRKATFPWGEDGDACEHAVVTRIPLGNFRCPGKTGPLPVDDPASQLDINALGIFGLGGNMSEFTLDAYYNYDDPCWTSQGPIDPSCVDPSAPFHSLRGGSWKKPLFMTRSVTRFPMRTATRGSDHGFRCAYRTPPARQWSAL